MASALGMDKRLREHKHTHTYTHTPPHVHTHTHRHTHIRIMYVYVYVYIYQAKHKLTDSTNLVLANLALTKGAPVYKSLANSALALAFAHLALDNVAVALSQLQIILL